MTGENLQVNGDLTLRRNPTRDEVAASIMAAMKAKETFHRAPGPMKARTHYDGVAVRLRTRLACGNESTLRRRKLLCGVLELHIEFDN